MKTVHHFFKGLVWMFAFAMALTAIPYLALIPDWGFLAGKSPDVKTDTFWRICFYVHVLGGMLAIATGPFQFMPKLRARHLRTHRRLGKLYVVSILIASTLSLYTAIHADGGVWGKAGFIGLGLAWFITTYVAFRKIRQGQVVAHEYWMIRSYAVTFSAVSFRLLVPVGILSGFAFMQAYTLSTWLCWIINLGVAEYLIRQKRTSRLKVSKPLVAS